MPRPINGRDKVLRLLAAINQAAQEFDLHFEMVPINGQPGALFRDATGRLLNLVVLDILDRTIQALRAVVDPEKLHHLGPLITADHPLRGGGRRRS